ncbi:MAG: response regulator [Nitrospira sp.]|nr:MAG: response regulator [Nitrospira sp.]
MASILIVEDDAPVRALLRNILEEDGHHIREAENGQIGLSSTSRSSSAHDA